MFRVDRRWRALFLLAAAVALVVLSNHLVDLFTAMLQMELRPSNEPLVHRMLMAAALAYALLIALPFVPGVEVGLALMALLGPPAVLLVYLATLAGLSLSFVVGRLVPATALVRLADDLHLRRLAALLRRVAPMDREQRLAFLVERAPTRVLPLLLAHRHLSLALALNLPGNFLLGGGGGISLVAGLSGLFSTGGFVATIVLAVLPVPLAVLLLGAGFLRG